MKTKILLAALAPAMLAGFAVPASAQDWHQGRGYENRMDRGQDRMWQVNPRRDAMIRADIEQLDNGILRAQQRRTISPREAQGLRMQARDAKRMYYSYARDGLNRNEVMALEQRVNQIRAQLRMERRDWNNWRG